MLPKNVEASFTLGKEMRLPWESRWQDLIDLAMPYRTHFFGNNPEGSRGQAQGQVYDETGMVGIQEMANRLQTGIVPDGIEWAVFEAAEETTDEFKAGLAAVQKRMFDAIRLSNFSPEMNDALPDLCGPGNVCMSVLPGTTENPLSFQAIPLADVWVTPGRRGGWGDIHARHRMRGYAIEADYPGSCPERVKSKPNDLYEVIDSWIRDLSSPTERWMQVCHLEGKETLFTKEHVGAGSCRYLFARWQRASGELYGTGQGMLALPAIRVVNEVTRLILSHADLALAGMWQAEDDGVLNPWSVQLVPGAIVSIAPGSKGLQPLSHPGTRLDIGQLVLSEQRHNIRKALYNETMGAREGTPPTALEIQERMAELARQIGPAYGRVWQELIVPLMQRVRRILEHRGVIRMPDIDGRKVKVRSGSALVRAAAFGEVRRVDQWMAGIAAHYGPQALPTLIPADRYMRFTLDRMNIPADLPFSPKEMAANAQRVGEMVGQGAAMGVDVAALLAGLGGGR